MNNKVYFIRLMLLFMSDWTINWSRTDSSASFIRRQLTFYKASSLIIAKKNIDNMITSFMNLFIASCTCDAMNIHTRLNENL